MPTQFIWTNGTANGLASTAANWTDPLGGPSAVPGSGDYMLFGSGGSNTSITVNINMSVDRVVMDSSYTATVTIGSGNSLTTNNQFVQYGTLNIAGTGDLNVGTFFDGNGSIINTPGIGTTGTIDVTGSFYLNSGGSLTATSGFGDVFAISSAGFDDGGTLNAGTLTTPGTLAIAGPYTQASGAVANIFSGGTLAFSTGGITGAHATMQGTISMGTGTFSTGGSAISSASELYLDGATLTSVGFRHNSMVGDIGVYNGGVITVGDGTFPSTLAHLTGSLTVGAPDPSGTATGGTVNVQTSSFLTFPSAANSSTFVVTAQGEVNMYGALIVMDGTRVSAMEIQAGGVLNTYGAYGGSGFPVVGDTITGNVLNDGLLQYLGVLHGLSIFASGSVAGNYTQGSTGTLAMRLDNTPASDLLAVAGNVGLNGTLSVTDLQTLTANQTWTLIDFGGTLTGDFATKLFPGSSPPWQSGFDAGSGDYVVVN